MWDRLFGRGKQDEPAEPTCASCGRTLLPGEWAQTVVRDDGSEEVVCSLCAQSAAYQEQQSGYPAEHATYPAAGAAATDQHVPAEYATQPAPYDDKMPQQAPAGHFEGPAEPFDTEAATGQYEVPDDSHYGPAPQPYDAQAGPAGVDAGVAHGDETAELTAAPLGEQAAPMHDTSDHVGADPSAVAADAVAGARADDVGRDDTDAFWRAIKDRDAEIARLQGEIMRLEAERRELAGQVEHLQSGEAAPADAQPFDAEAAPPAGDDALAATAAVAAAQAVHPDEPPPEPAAAGWDQAQTSATADEWTSAPQQAEDTASFTAPIPVADDIGAEAPPGADAPVSPADDGQVADQESGLPLFQQDETTAVVEPGPAVFPTSEQQTTDADAKSSEVPSPAAYMDTPTEPIAAVDVPEETPMEPAAIDQFAAEQGALEGVSPDQRAGEEVQAQTMPGQVPPEQETGFEGSPDQMSPEQVAIEQQAPDQTPVEHVPVEPAAADEESVQAPVVQGQEEWCPVCDTADLPGAAVATGPGVAADETGTVQMDQVGGDVVGHELVFESSEEPPDLHRLQRGADLLNVSETPAKVAETSELLGLPAVHLSSEDDTVKALFLWSMAWYEYSIDLDTGDVTLLDRGYDDRSGLRPNASAKSDGTVQPAPIPTRRPIVKPVEPAPADQPPPAPSDTGTDEPPVDVDDDDQQTEERRPVVDAGKGHMISKSLKGKRTDDEGVAWDDMAARDFDWGQ